MFAPVIWLTFDETPSRCRWDQDFIDVLAPSPEYLHYGEYEPEPWPDVDGAVFVFPAGHNEKYIPQLNATLSKFRWVVLLLTSDEESTFPWWKVHHPNMRIWVQCPRSDKHSNPSLRHFPMGAPRHGWYDNADLINSGLNPKTLDWSFHGQVNHLQREEMLKALEGLPNGRAYATEGFTRGLSREAYLRFMIQSKVCPAPSGPACADSFRFWEALEAGAIPIVDEGPKPDPQGRAVTNYPRDYWSFFPLQFEELRSWDVAPLTIANLAAQYPTVNNLAFSAYQWYKRNLRQQLVHDVEEVSGRAREHPLVTVLVPTSPTPNNPSMNHLITTIASIRDQLSDAEIIVMFDGVRQEQEHRRADYEEYQRQALWMCNHIWRNVTPLRFHDHAHQVGMTRKALDHVDTPLVMFVEHDTPLYGRIEWDYVFDALMRDRLDLVRFYHEAELQSEHKHLMLDSDGRFIRTEQWSQRPHVATTDYYRRILLKHFTPRANSMIEDKMHSVVQTEKWARHRLAIYAPDGDIHHSTHLDARGEDPKYEMRF